MGRFASAMRPIGLSVPDGMSNGDRGLPAYLPGRQLAHGLSHLIERIAPAEHPAGDSSWSPMTGRSIRSAQHIG
jgi:hypothetical protein